MQLKDQCKPIISMDYNARAPNTLKTREETNKKSDRRKFPRTGGCLFPV